MRKSILNFFIAFVAVCTGLQAQSISGSVTDSEDGEPLAVSTSLFRDKIKEQFLISMVILP